MTTNLKYNFVASHEKNGVLTVGLADSQYDTTEYIWFQRCLDPDEDDGIYIERDDQGQGTYGGIEKLVLSRNRIELYLSEETAESLDTEREVIIDFSATDEQYKHFENEMKRAFENESILELR